MRYLAILCAPQIHADALLIASAPSDIAYLLERVRAAEEVVRLDTAAVYCDNARNAFDPDMYNCARCGHPNGSHCGPNGCPTRRVAP
jgi:hypothetical protein